MQQDGSFSVKGKHAIFDEQYQDGDEVKPIDPVPEPLPPPSPSSIRKSIKPKVKNLHPDWLLLQHAETKEFNEVIELFNQKNKPRRLVRNSERKNAAHYAAMSSLGEDALLTIVRNLGEDCLTQRDLEWATPLHYCMGCFSKARLDQILSYKHVSVKDLRRPAKTGDTVLHFAAMNQNTANSEDQSQKEYVSTRPPAYEEHFSNSEIGDESVEEVKASNVATSASENSSQQKEKNVVKFKTATDSAKAADKNEQSSHQNEKNASSVAQAENAAGSAKAADKKEQSSHQNENNASSVAEAETAAGSAKAADKNEQSSHQNENNASSVAEAETAADSAKAAEKNEQSSHQNDSKASSVAEAETAADSAKAADKKEQSSHQNDSKASSVAEAETAADSAKAAEKNEQSSHQNDSKASSVAEAETAADSAKAAEKKEQSSHQNNSKASSVAEAETAADSAKAAEKNEHLMPDIVCCLPICNAKSKPKPKSGEEKRQEKTKKNFSQPLEYSADVINRTLLQLIFDKVEKESEKDRKKKIHKVFSVVNAKKQTLLHLAAMYSSPEELSTLLKIVEHFQNPEEYLSMRDEDGNHFYHYAVWNKDKRSNQEIVKKMSPGGLPGEKEYEWNETSDEKFSGYFRPFWLKNFDQQTVLQSAIISKDCLDSTTVPLIKDLKKRLETEKNDEEKALLLKKIMHRDRFGNTALILSLKHEKIGTAKLLFELTNHIHWTVLNNEGKGALHYAFLYQEFSSYLKTHKKNIYKRFISENIIDNAGRSCVFYACTGWNFEPVTDAMEMFRGKEQQKILTRPDFDGNTLLHALFFNTSVSGNLKEVLPKFEKAFSSLVKNGVSLKKENNLGQNCLHASVLKQDVLMTILEEATRILRETREKKRTKEFDRDPSVSLGDAFAQLIHASNGFHVVHAFASKYQLKELVKLLSELSESPVETLLQRTVSKGPWKGATCLHFACETNHQANIDYLMSKKNRLALDAETYSGRSAIDFAKVISKAEVVKKIFKRQNKKSKLELLCLIDPAHQGLKMPRRVEARQLIASIMDNEAVKAMRSVAQIHDQSAERILLSALKFDSPIIFRCALRLRLVARKTESRFLDFLVQNKDNDESEEPESGSDSEADDGHEKKQQSKEQALKNHHNSLVNHDKETSSSPKSKERSTHVEGERASSADAIQKIKNPQQSKERSIKGEHASSADAIQKINSLQPSGKSSLEGQHNSSAQSSEQSKENKSESKNKLQKRNLKTYIGLKQMHSSSEMLVVDIALYLHSLELLPELILTRQFELIPVCLSLLLQLRIEIVENKKSDPIRNRLKELKSIVLDITINAFEGLNSIASNEKDERLVMDYLNGRISQNEAQKNETKEKRSAKAQRKLCGPKFPCRYAKGQQKIYDPKHGKLKYYTVFEMVELLGSKDIFSTSCMQQLVDKKWQELEDPYRQYFNPKLKYYIHFLAFATFLVFFAWYIIDFRRTFQSAVPEVVMACYLLSFTVQEAFDIYRGRKMRYFFRNDSIWKYPEYFKEQLNLFDCAAILFMWVGLLWKWAIFSTGMEQPTAYACQMVLSSAFLLWGFRSVSFLSYFETIGPVISMMRSLLIKDLLPFAAITLVIFYSSSVFFFNLLFPASTATAAELDSDTYTASVFQQVFTLPFILFLDNPPDYESSANGTDQAVGSVANPTGNTAFKSFFVFAFLLVVNVVMVNLLIALFSLRVSTMVSRARCIWSSKRFYMLQEFKKATIVPPPLSFLQHIITLLEKVKCGGSKVQPMLAEEWWKSNEGVAYPARYRKFLKLQAEYLSAKRPELVQKMEQNQPDFEGLKASTSNALAQLQKRLEDTLDKQDERLEKLEKMDERLGKLERQSKQMKNQDKMQTSPAQNLKRLEDKVDELIKFMNSSRSSIQNLRRTNNPRVRENENSEGAPT